MNSNQTDTNLYNLRRSAVTMRVSGKARRGNTLVLVAGILVLLVIIATSYLTTTQSQRSTSVAQQAAAQRDDNAEVIGEMLAQQLADALFVWPVDWDDPALDGDDPMFTGIADANFPRKRPAPNARRYGVDPNYPYNFAPYHTVPFTNWPDWSALATGDALDAMFFNARQMPAGPGNLYFEAEDDQAGDGFGEPAIAAVLSAEFNPLGNPGFGDNRWLRDTEPVRWDTGQFPNGLTPGVRDAFSHWRKLTNIASANNGWRIVWDISDVDNHIFTDMNVPVEQWLNIRPRFGTGASPFNPVSGGTAYNLLIPQDRFWRQWQTWFNRSDFDFTYADALVNNAFGAPPNLYKLNDLNASGTRHNFVIGGVPQDTPDAEFVRGTARHTVSRVLTDTTGDGFTDSFWFLSPAPVRGGIRQVVGVSIVDNSARLNANVATRFWREDPAGTNWHERKTRGHTPADLALVGQMNQVGGDNTWNVGFYDNPANWAYSNEDGIGYTQTYEWSGTANLRWHRHLEETGLPFDGTNVTPNNQRLRADDRLDYWQYSGRLGLAYDDRTKNSASGFTYKPFGLSDELELRMFEGNNNPWMYTRYEYTTHGTQPDPGGPMNPGSTGFLRAGAFDQETSEYMDQLNNRELLRDNRRKLTLYSGARNDQLAPSLWWEYRSEASEANWPPRSLPSMIRRVFNNPPSGWSANVWERMVVRNFREQSRRKLDLREPDYWYHTFRDGTRDPMYIFANNHDPNDAGRLNLRERLAPSLLLALTDGPDDIANWISPGYEFGTYFGPYTSNNYDTPAGRLNRTRRMAAGFAANILAYRSNQPVTLEDRVPLPPYGQPPDGSGSTEYLPEGVLDPAGATTTTERAFLGIDPQPFLVEAFIGHVYKPMETVPQNYIPNTDQLDADGVAWDCDTTELPEDYEQPIPYSNAGRYIIFDEPEARSVILVVQIANPFDVPIDLWEYRIKAFGNDDLILQDVIPADLRWLYPATNEQPRTVTFYAMRDQIEVGGVIDELAEQWRQFLDIDLIDSGLQVAVAGDNEKLAPGSMVVNVSGFWNVEERSSYDCEDDGSGTECWSNDELTPGGIELSRMMDDGTGTPQRIVIDRFASTESSATHVFNSAVQQMGSYRPRPRASYELELCTEPPIIDDSGDDDDNGGSTEGEFPAYTVENTTDHWIQWVRATRAWGVDVNGNGLYERHESNPRFVFGDLAVVVPTSAGTPDSSRFDGPRHSETGVPVEIDEERVLMGANVYDFSSPPNGVNPPPAVPDPWFTRKYYAADGRLMDQDPQGGTVDRPARKPTFFDMNFFADPASENGTEYFRSYPDKGWYGQFSLEREDAVNYDPDFDEFNITGVGGAQRAVGVTGRVNGVDDFTVLDANTDNLTPAEPLMNWTGPPVQMFRHPFSMQMTLKNKIFPAEFDQFPSGWTPDDIDFLTRNRDFEQIGEVLNVWLFGHEINRQSTGDPFETVTTFAEFMSASRAVFTGLPRTFTDLGAFQQWQLNGEAARVNRLHMKPQRAVGGSIDGVGMLVNRPTLPDNPTEAQLLRYYGDPRHSWPAVPAGARVLDLFVCDGPGRWPYDELFGTVPPLEPLDFIDALRFYNANAFNGRMTPGLININTATPEVMRALPHMTRIVGEWPNTVYPFVEWPFPRITDAIVRYRDRIGAPIWDLSIGLPEDIGPAYAHRGRTQDFFAYPTTSDNENNKLVPGMRGDRGFASLGELSLLTQSGRSSKSPPSGDISDADRFLYVDMGGQPGDAFLEIDWNSSWRMDYAAMPDREQYRFSFPDYFEPGATENPYVFLFAGEPDFEPSGFPAIDRTSWSARISTSTSVLYDPDESESTYEQGMMPDATAEDLHEANLLLAGISNLVTTRSDTFVVHFRVRSFRQNPVTGVWDATDPEHIVDDTRYVMLVDRSNVNSPSDKPRILFLEKLAK